MSTTDLFADSGGDLATYVPGTGQPWGRLAGPVQRSSM